MNLLTNEKPLIVLPNVATVIGVDEAILLQQLHYRLQQQTVLQNGEAWYCQSHANWRKQLPFWNEPKIKRIILQLEQLELVHSTDRFNQFYVDRTKWYKIDYDKLQSMLADYKEQQSIDDDAFAQLTTNTVANQNEPKRNKKTAQNVEFVEKIDTVLTYLNVKASKRFSLKSQANRNFISARLKEGYSVEDCCLVIDEQVLSWLDDQEMEKYLRPMTLFRPSNFESYLNNALSKKDTQTRMPKAIVLDFNAGEDW